MIVRRWCATADNERRYISHFRRRVLPQLRRFAGYRGALVIRRPLEAGIGIEVLTFWASMASIREFAGDHADRAVVEEEAKAVLKRFDSRVQHFDVVLDALSIANPRKRDVASKALNDYPKRRRVTRG